MTFATLTKGKPRYFKARESAAAESWSFQPPNIYAWRGGSLPQTVQAYAASGVLEEIADPGSGFDTIEVRDTWFTAPVRRDPPPPKMFTLEETIAYVGFSGVKQLREAIARHNFPAESAYKEKKFNERNPDDRQAPLWLQVTLDKWLDDMKQRQAFIAGLTSK